MQKLSDLEVGDPVVVIRSYGRGGPERHVVTKKGTKLITVVPESCETCRGAVFRMEDGSFNDKDYSYHAHVFTLEQYEYKVYHDGLIEKLRNLRVQFPHNLSVEKLAKLVAVLEESDDD